MQWVKATAPNGRENWINLDLVPNILESDDGGSIIFMGAITTIDVKSVDGKSAQRPQYLTTATKESPTQLLSLPRFDSAEYVAAATAVKAKTKASRPRKSA
jgi:hypothetical protein